MAKKCNLEGLETAVKQILDTYNNEVNKNLDAITKDVTKKGVQA